MFIFFFFFYFIITGWGANPRTVMRWSSFITTVEEDQVKHTVSSKSTGTTRLILLFVLYTEFEWTEGSCGWSGGRRERRRRKRECERETEREREAACRTRWSSARRQNHHALPSGSTRLLSIHSWHLTTPPTWILSLFFYLWIFLWNTKLLYWLCSVLVHVILYIKSKR